MTFDSDSLTFLSLDALAEAVRKAEPDTPAGNGTQEYGPGSSLPPVPDGPPPLSYAQERLWFMDRLSPGNPFYNVTAGLEITGPLDQDALYRAWTIVIGRHETLKSSFPPSAEGKPEVKLLPEDCCPMLLRDIGGQSPEEQEKSIAEAKEREVTDGFDLETGPLCRAVLFRQGEDRFTLLFTLHHIIYDGWSQAVFLDELFTAYEALRQGREPRLPDLPAQYSQFALWQRGLMEGSYGEREYAWWKDYLADIPELELRTDFPRPAVQSFRGEKLEFTLDAALQDRLEALGRKHGATPFMVWLAIYAIVLGRYSGQRRFAVGNSIAGRTHPATENMIGFFVNNMVVKTDNRPEQTFLEHLAVLRENTLLSFSHGDLPFQFLAKGAGKHLDLSRNPVYQAGLTYQNTPPAGTPVEGLSFRSLHIPLKTNHLDVELIAWPTKEGLFCCLLYARDLFSEKTAHRFRRSFEDVARTVADKPEATLDELFRDARLFPPPVRGESVMAGAEGGFPFVPPWERLRRLAEEAPGAPALILADDLPDMVPAPGPGEGETVTISRSRLLAMAEAKAARLAGLPVGRGHVTALLLRSGAELLVTMLAVWRQGGAWLCLDPEHPPLRNAEILRHAGADLLISTPEDAAALDLAGNGLEGLRVHMAGHWRDLTPGEAAPPEAEVLPADVAFFVHTSGSTGVPKGVPVTHGSGLHRMAWMWKTHPLGQNDLVCQKNSVVFIDFYLEAFTPLLSGTPLLLLGHSASRDVERLAAKMEQYKVTRLHMVASLLKTIHHCTGGLRGRLQSLRSIITTGEPMEVALAAKTVEAVPGLSIVNMYGSTEMFNPASFHATGESLAGLEQDGFLPAGPPVADMITAVLDENLLPVPLGESGMIYVSGPGLTPGYISGAGQDAFCRLNILGRDRRFFRTGDLGGIDSSGRLRYLGRRDHQIKIRGIRIEAGEVQAAMNACPGVRESIVMPWKDHADGHARLVGFAVLDAPLPEAGEVEWTADFRAFLLERLPAVMVPDMISVLDDWPRTASGKISRPLMLKDFTRRMREREAPARNGLVAADTVKGRLAAVWSQVTLVPGIPETSNFFEIGGNSLLLVTLHERIQQEFGRTFPLTALFRNPTIESQAGFLEGVRAEPERPEKVREGAQKRDTRNTLLAARRQAARA